MPPTPKPRIASVLLIATLFAAVVFFRARAFQTNLQFDSDFGRDSLFAMRILQGKPTLLGPQASVGGFYLAPAYFYLVALVYKLGGYQPQLMQIVFISMGVFTIVLGYILQKRYLSRTAAVLFLLIAAANPSLVTASRTATNQPMIPLVLMLTVLTLMWAIEKKHIVWYVLSGLAFGLFFHVHFSALLILPAFLALVFFQQKGTFTQKIVNLFAVGAGMLLMLSPLILFDVRHDWITSKAFLAYLRNSATGNAITLNFPHWSFQEKLQNILTFSAPDSLLGIVVALLTILGWKKRPKHLAPTTTRYLAAITTLFLGGVLFLFLYKGYLFGYYLLVELTLSTLVISAYVSFIRPRLIPVALCVALLILFATHLRYQPNFRTIANLTPIVQGIERDIAASSINNFTIFKDSHDGMTGLGYEYRFLLQRDGYTPISEFTYEKANVMYLIAERGMVDPKTLPYWEVTQFGPKRFEVINVFSYPANTVYLLRITK